MENEELAHDILTSYTIFIFSSSFKLSETMKNRYCYHAFNRITKRLPFPNSLNTVNVPP